MQLTARTSTDTGFLKMFQAILILQGAKLTVRNVVEEGQFNFAKDPATDIPENLPIIQVQFIFLLFKLF